MKKIYLLLLLFASQVSLAQSDFITRWDLSEPGAVAGQIIFNATTTGPVSYTWQEVSPGTASGSGSFTDGEVAIDLPEDAIVDLHINPANFSAFNTEDTGDGLKLVDVRQWGTTVWTTMHYAFYECRNLRITATDVPDLTLVTDVSYMFLNCRTLNGPANIGSWDMSGVTNMESMFDGANAFNRPIGTWNTASVTNMAYMFYDARAFNQPIHTWHIESVETLYSMFYDAQAFNQSVGDWTLKAAVNLSFIFTNSGLDCYQYSETLKGWSANPDTPDNLTLDASGRTYSPSAAPSRDNLITAKGWTIQDDAASDTECIFTAPPLEETKFITRWDLSKSGSGQEQINFDVTTSGPVTYTWQEVSPGTEAGSGTFDNGNITITNLPAGAIIDLSINAANFNAFSIGSGPDPERLIDVRQWGTTAWTSMAIAFYGCSNMNVSATDVPDLSGVTSTSMMFMYCAALTGPSNIGSWDMSKVENMSSMFDEASVFNQNIKDWNTTSATNMTYMFSGAAAFNQPIGSWDTENVTNMSQMFLGARAFNQPIENWKTQHVSDMGYMFSGARAFDQSLGNWTLAPATNLNAIFNSSGLSCFNYGQTLKGWSANPETPDGLTLDGGDKYYSPSAVNARNNLLAKGWTISNDSESAAECTDPLPVTLVSFSGQKNDENRNVLKWATTNETDFDHFEIQRSANARSFEKIGVVYGKATGAIHTPVLNEYHFIDTPVAPSHYYRLKMIDRDGSFAYSRIISIKNEAPQAVVGNFYPNPSRQKTMVDVTSPESGCWTLTVTDASGKNMTSRTYNLQKGKNTISVEHFTQGINLIRFEYGRFSETRKLVRE